MMKKSCDFEWHGQLKSWQEDMQNKPGCWELKSKLNANL